jgi:hypothetical protein
MESTQQFATVLIANPGPFGILPSQGALLLRADVLWLKRILAGVLCG